MRPVYLDSLIANVPLELIHFSLHELPGVVMIEDLGLAETHMNEAVPNMGWKKFGRNMATTEQASQSQFLTQESK